MAQLAHARSLVSTELAEGKEAAARMKKARAGLKRLLQSPEKEES